MGAFSTLGNKAYNYLKPVIDGYHELATHAREIVVVIKLAPFSVFVVLGVSGLLFVEQTLEALRVLAENWTDQPIALLFSLVALVYLSITAWYCARVLILQLDPDALVAEGSRGNAARWVPRLAGAFAWASFAGAALRASR